MRREKSIRLLILLVGFLLIYTKNFIKAEVIDQVPLKINIKDVKSKMDIKVEVVTEQNLYVSIQEDNSIEKKIVYEGLVEENIIVSGINLDKKYNINIEDYLGNIYSGSFYVYDKEASDFIGIEIDINKVDCCLEENHSEDFRTVSANTIYESENNNSFKKANKIFDTAINGKIGKKGDVDYYKTMFYEEGDGKIVLSNIPEEQDYDIYVYDSDKKEIAFSCGASKIESVTIDDVNTYQWYYIKICGYKKSYDKDNYYKLIVNTIPDPSSIYGHAFESAKVITTLNSITGEILSKDDKCYFKFTPNKNTKYKVYTQGELDTYGILYNKDKDILITQLSHCKSLNSSLINIA